MKRTKGPLVWGAFGAALIGFMISAPSIEAARCDTDVVPAATLLIPWFEVDTTNPSGVTTTFAVTNRSSSPVLTNVVLWTDLAIPTLTFQVYLAGYDTQTINLRDVFRGQLPVTGSAVSAHALLSDDPVAFPGCNSGTVPRAAPVYPNPALTEHRLAQALAWHTGQCFDNQVGGSGFNSAFAHGYVTIDVVERCSNLTPADSGYFGTNGVAGSDNVLLGDYFLIDSSQDFAQGEPAVHIEAFPGSFAAENATFYGRYVDGATDAREPLGTQYEVRHLAGGPFDGGTRLIVWRDTGSPDVTPGTNCQAPDWFGNDGLETYAVFFDEDGNSEAYRDTCDILPPCPGPLRFATQAIQLAGGEDAVFDLVDRGFGFGRTRLVTRPPLGESSSDWPILQGWVTALVSAENRYSVGVRAVRLDSACDPGPIVPAPEDFQ